MIIEQGYSYHIKDDFFEMIKDDYLMSNKENGNYRPHYYAIRDKKNENIFWMIPISSQVEKFKKIAEKKVKKFGKCNTIILGTFGGRKCAFLIQNAFPVLEKYFDHVHTIENKPITIHKELNRDLTINLREVLALHNRGINLIFPDIDMIREKMELELVKDE